MSKLYLNLILDCNSIIFMYITLKICKSKFILSDKGLSLY